MQLDIQTKSLIVDFKLGKEEALNHLFGKYHSRILRIVRFRLDPQLRSLLRVQSMDIVQEVFLYALQHLKDFEPQSQGHFLHWLSKKVQHYIYDRLDYIKRKKRMATGGEISLDQEYKPKGENSEFKLQIKDDGPTPSHFAVIKEREELVDTMLEQLEPEQREIIIKRDLEELTFKEIGEMINKSEEAARKQYCRAFKKLIDLSEAKLKPVMAELTYKQYKYGL
jgi:RNA polymerase sigma-70 factor, ECF subfamily